MFQFLNKNSQTYKNKVTLNTAIEDFKSIVDKYHSVAGISESEFSSDRHSNLAIKSKILKDNSSTISINFKKDKNTPVKILFSLNHNKEFKFDNSIVNNQALFNKVLASITNISHKVGLLSQEFLLKS